MPSKFKTLIAAGAGIAAASAFATPAAAQAYPYGYGGNQGVLGAIINGVLGAGQYGRYPYGNQGYGAYGMNQRQAVDQCARTVENEINRRTGANYGRYNNGRYTNGYDNGRYNGYNTGYGYDQRARDGGRVPDQYRTDPYVQQYGTYGGNARIAGITDVNRKGRGLKVKGVAMSGQYAANYGRYGRQGYGYDQRPDIKWTCEIDYNGRIRDIDIRRR